MPLVKGGDWREAWPPHQKRAGNAPPAPSATGPGATPLSGEEKD